MAKKKAAGFKMKKSPNKTRFAAGTDPEYIRQVNQSLYGSLNEAPKPGNQIGFPGRPRGMFGMSQGFPRGLFGRKWKNNTPRHVMAQLAPNLYGRPKREGFMATILDRLRDKMPKRLFGRNLEAERGVMGNTTPRPIPSWMKRLTPEQKRQMVINERPNPYAGMANPYEGGGTMGQDNIIMNAAPMAKKSGFTMKRGGKPNKSEFFKGKK